MKRALPTVLSVLVLAAAAWLWRDRIDLGTVGGRLARLDPALAALALALYLSFSPLNAARLKSVAGWVADASLPYLALLRVTCIGQFVAVVAPVGLLGDAARVGLMRPLGGMTWRSSVQAVLCDRASGAVFCACLGAALLPARMLLGAPARELAIEAAVFLLAAGGAALLAALQPRHVGPRLWELGGWLTSALRALFAGPRRIAAQLGFAAANVLVTLATLVLLARGMGIPVGALQLLQFVPIIMLVSALPLLYLGWGGREMVMVSTVGSLPGVLPADALSLALSVGALAVLAGFPNGLALLTGWRPKAQT